MISTETFTFPQVESVEYKTAGQITVVLDPKSRLEYLKYVVGIDGLINLVEDVHAAYCPISLTQTPEELKPVLARRQSQLKSILAQVGITGYDPADAPYSPDTNLHSQPNEVYSVDSGKILGARYFIGHHLLPSSGFGTEAQKAIQFNRVPIILIDKHIRVSRMQPHRTIYLEYDDFERQSDQFAEVFDFVQHFEPGMGFNGRTPVLLGFGLDGSVVDLEEAVYRRFPDLQYHYDGQVPILKLRAENPELFYDFVPHS